MKRAEFISKTGAGIATAVTVPFAAGFPGKKSPQKNMKEKVVRNGDGKKLNVLGDKMTVKLTGKDTDWKVCLD